MLELFVAEVLGLVVAPSLEECTGVVSERGDVVRAGTYPVEAMCRRTQAQVGDALPVACVVPCVAVGEGEVRYLVVLVASSLEFGDEHLEEAQACLLRHGLYLASLDKACERGTFLIDEVVGREVRDAE